MRLYQTSMLCVCVCLQEAQLNEVLAASNLDPSALTMVTRKLEVPHIGCVCVYIIFITYNRMYWIVKIVLSEIYNMS